MRQSGTSAGAGGIPEPETGGTSGPSAAPPDDSGPVGPFPSWGALYATVVVYAVGVIVLLYLFTVFLDVAPTGP